MPERPDLDIDVWLSTREYPSVRVRVNGFDLSLERVADRKWDVVSIMLPDGGPLMVTGGRDRFRLNNVSLIEVAETSYAETPEGAGQLDHRPRRDPRRPR